MSPAGSQPNNSGLPVIVLVHGAWHTPSHYTYLTSHLEHLGYTVVTPSLPSCSSTSTSPNATVSDDSAQIRSILSSCLNAGQKIIVIAHSYGGIPTTDAVVGETVCDRQARGLEGGVSAVVYLAAFAPLVPGFKLFDVIGVDNFENVPEWWTVNHEDGYSTINTFGLNALYQDVEPQAAQDALNGTGKQSLNSFSSCTVHAASEITAPVTYIAAKLDAAIPFEGQKAMAAAAGAKVVEVECSHSPFLVGAHANRVVEIVDGLGRKS